MSQKVLNSRVLQKIDTEANWELHRNFVPLAGELIIYVADANHPYPRMKVGNGVTTIANLAFINSGSSQKVNHTLTFGAGGAYTFDGSQDVTVPVYTGSIVGG